MIPKMTWQERVKETESFHKDHLRKDESHTLRKTADLLRRAVGSISEDLLLASWIKTHPKVENFDTMCEAIEWIRDKKRELRIR